MRTHVYAGEQLARYGFPGGHPFSPHRFGAFYREFISRSLNQRTTVCAPHDGPAEILQPFHTQSYVGLVRDFSQRGYGLLDRGDTPAFPGCFEAALTVCATVLAAVEDIMQGKAEAAFVPIAGLHHARRNTAGGFCIFNDIGIAIEHLLTTHKLQRIAYVDIDAHHGDGVYYEFESEPRLIFADLHQEFIYPGTGDTSERGKGPAQGLKLNIPMPDGADDRDFAAAWEQVIDHLRQHRPEFIILQCGADSLKGDPLTGMAYSPKSFTQAAQDLAKLAQEYAHGRLLALGGGGYNLANIAAGWNNVVAALATA